MIRLIFILSVLISTSARGEPTKAVFEQAAREAGVSVNILRSICIIESGLLIKAYNHHDGGFNNSAFGVCQVLLRTAEELGFRDHRRNCANGKKSCGLFHLKTNVRYAAKYLKKQLVRYDHDYRLAVAAYNSGSARKCRKRLCNHKYVDKVFKIYNTMGGVYDK